MFICRLADDQVIKVFSYIKGKSIIKLTKCSCQAKIITRSFCTCYLTHSLHKCDHTQENMYTNNKHQLSIRQQLECSFDKLMYLTLEKSQALVFNHQEIISNSLAQVWHLLKSLLIMLYLIQHKVIVMNILIPSLIYEITDK